MKAAVLYELKTPLKVEDVDLDNPKAGEVRVQIVANGVCHSDYSVIHGVLRSPLPVVPGHEGAGIVEEVGPGVSLVQAGDQAPEVEGSQPIRDNLKKRIGSRVTLRLAAEEEIGGKVVAVGEHAVHLSELAGKEFFDAVIRLDQVSAVVVRAREK